MLVSELMSLLGTMPPDALVVVPGAQAEFYDALQPDEVRLRLAAEVSPQVANWFQPAASSFRPAANFPGAALFCTLG